MTKAFPNIIIKEPDDEQDMGFKGGPVKKQQKSWREMSGTRRSFGPPSGGWPQFSDPSPSSAEEDDVVKRRTDKAPAEEKLPKGTIAICPADARKAGLEHEIPMMAGNPGKCSVCRETNQVRMFIEESRYLALVEREEAKDGEATSG